ncbi:MAG: hypothetical protein RMJ33_14650 [Saprospiraceae bacterium]|nr:hypothetical protein [Saprospiraceae bacterium]MDW8231069.1 hypothetical protein [Saprospiraceae bacterium]
MFALEGANIFEAHLKWVEIYVGWMRQPPHLLFNVYRANEYGALIGSKEDCRVRAPTINAGSLNHMLDAFIYCVKIHQ